MDSVNHNNGTHTAEVGPETTADLESPWLGSRCPTSPTGIGSPQRRTYPMNRENR